MTLAKIEVKWGTDKMAMRRRKKNIYKKDLRIICDQTHFLFESPYFYSYTPFITCMIQLTSNIIQHVHCL